MTTAIDAALEAPVPTPPTAANMVFPRGDIVPTDARAWMDNEERAIFTALSCPDFKISTTTQVMLQEHQTLKRVPKQEKWSQIQQVRAHMAERLREFLNLGLTPSTPRMLLLRIAALRGWVPPG